MPWPIIDHIRAAILYTKAGNSVDRRDYETAKEQMEKVWKLLGKKADRCSLFEFDLRTADIYRHTNQIELAISSARFAKDKIIRNSKLSPADKNYLLDYSDILIAEITGEDILEVQLRSEDCSRVSKRYMRYFPLAWS